MFFTTTLCARSAADKIRRILRGTSPRTRKPTLLDPSELEYHTKLFHYFDKNHDYYLDKNELNNLVKYQSQELQKFDVNKPFKRMDLNNDNRISKQEYLEHIVKRKKQLPMKHELEEIFDMYDTNKDAFIDLDEFRQVMLYMGEDFSRPDLRKLFEDVDKDKDGLIDFGQFKILLYRKIRA